MSDRRSAGDDARPPRLALWVAGLRVPRGEREFAQGDLAEEFADRTARDGRRAARRWFRRQALRCLAGRRSDTARAFGTTNRATSGGFMSGFSRDLAFALRLIRRTPLLSAAAVFTFALGIGANTAVFSVAWPVLAEPLAFPQEGRLAFVLLSVPRPSGPGANPISPGDYFDLMEARSFERLGAFNMFATERNLAGYEVAQQVRVGTVTEDFFGVLGVQPLAGRGIDQRDLAAGTQPLVLNERAWRKYFGGDPDIVGKTAHLDGQSWDIVGVMPAAATVGTIDVDAWSIQPIDRATARQRRSYFLAMVGRLRPGVTLVEANAELAVIMSSVAERYPESNKTAAGLPILARAQSFRERLTGPVRPVFLLLLGGAALVLVVAGINLAGLQLSLNLARRSELSVRRALGAPRGQLVRQLTTESLVLSLLGGAAGLAAASLTLRSLAAFAPTVAWYRVSPTLTTPMVLYTVGLTIIAGLAVGLVPAIAASRTRHVGSLQARGGTASRATARLRTTVVGAQVAMTVVLLVAATLTAASLARVLDVDPGFEIDSGLIADVSPSGSQGESIAFFDELIERVEAVPGVERACAINHVPLDNAGGGMTFVAEGKTDANMEGALPMGVSEGCFETLRIPLVRGRAFERRETESVAIVNESMAMALWPDGEDPVGRRIHMGLVAGPLFTVVGVVRDIRASALESAFTRQVWLSASRGWPQPQRLIVRSAGPPSALARPIRDVIGQLDSTLALANIRTMSDIVFGATASRRFVLVLLGGFAAIALALSAVGIYGMLVHQVGQRTREIGIRVALGAQLPDVVRTVVGHVLVGVVAGVVVGIAGALLLSSVIATQLFQMSATDPRVYVAVVSFVALVAAIACWAPTRRAVRVNPVAALRAE